MKEMLLPILLTQDDLTELLSHIDRLLALLYTDISGIPSYLNSRMPEQLSTFFTPYLNDSSDIQSKEQWLKILRDEVSSFEKISLTLAIRPSRNMIENTIGLLRRQYGATLILDVHYNPDLIAGAELVYRGTYTDISARKRFDEVMLAMKGQVL